jgi:hypothetical protein
MTIASLYYRVMLLFLSGVCKSMVCLWLVGRQGNLAHALPLPGYIPQQPLTARGRGLMRSLSLPHPSSAGRAPSPQAIGLYVSRLSTRLSRIFQPFTSWCVRASKSTEQHYVSNNAWIMHSDSGPCHTAHLNYTGY